MKTQQGVMHDTAEAGAKIVFGGNTQVTRCRQLSLAYSDNHTTEGYFSHAMFEVELYLYRPGSSFYAEGRVVLKQHGRSGAWIPDELQIVDSDGSIYSFNFPDGTVESISLLTIDDREIAEVAR